MTSLVLAISLTALILGFMLLWRAGKRLESQLYSFTAMLVGACVVVGVFKAPEIIANPNKVHLLYAFLVLSVIAVSAGRYALSCAEDYNRGRK